MHGAAARRGHPVEVVAAAGRAHDARLEHVGTAAQALPDHPVLRRELRRKAAFGALWAHAPPRCGATADRAGTDAAPRDACAPGTPSPAITDRHRQPSIPTQPPSRTRDA